MATHVQQQRSAPRRSGGNHPCAPLVAKLSTVAELTSDEVAALQGLCIDSRRIGARRDIIREGDKPEHVHLVLEGWAARYKVLPDGSRQITAFLIPGDFCDLHVTVLGEMDHSILALTPTTVVYLSHGEMEALPERRPGLTRALWWTTLVDEAVLRSWIVNLGRRDAAERIAHLMCEMHLRMERVGLVEDGRFALPLTQEVLADATGLTSVHVNRMLQRLRHEELIELGQGLLEILDLEGLRRVAGFDPNYLHRGKLSRDADDPDA